MSIKHWIRVGLVPGVWGLIGGGAAASLAGAAGVDDALSRGIGMLAAITVAGGLRRRIRDAAERKEASDGRTFDPAFIPPDAVRHCDIEQVEIVKSAFRPLR